MVTHQFSFINASNRQIQTVDIDKVLGIDQDRRHRFVVIQHAHREVRVNTTESLRVLRLRLESDRKRAAELVELARPAEHLAA